MFREEQEQQTGMPPQIRQLQSPSPAQIFLIFFGIKFFFFSKLDHLANLFGVLFPDQYTE